MTSRVLISSVHPVCSLLMLFIVSMMTSVNGATQRFNATLRENSPIGTPILNFNLGLEESSNNMKCLQMKHDIFNVTIRNIVVNKPVDRENICPSIRTSPCTVTLECFYGTKGNTDLKTTIVIEDENDNRPVFPRSKVGLDIEETVQVGREYELPAATDLDTPEYGIRLYRLEGLNRDAFQLVRDGSRLLLKVVKSLDREVISEYKLKVVAVEKGNDYTVSMELTVNIIDSDDNPPVFDQSLYEVTINEGEQAATPIVQVIAKDKDHGDNALIVYSTEDKHGVSVHASTGQLTITGRLDAVDTPSIEVVVVASNPVSGLQAKTTILIHVIDFNEFSPKITVYGESDVFIAEKMKVDDFVARVRVSDEDRGRFGVFSCSLNHVAFKLEKQNINNFNIKTLNTDYDRETTDSYSLSVVCQDTGNLTSSKVLVVKVKDNNDNAPRFLKPVYTATVVENTDTDEVLLRVTAEDADIGDNAHLEYRIEDAFTSRFSVHSTRGDIRSLNVIDYESDKHIEFRVLVLDGGEPRLNGTSIIRLHIIDEDDQAPTFSSDGRFFFSIPENLDADNFVGKVLATDADSDMYSKFTLSLNDESEFFRLDSTSGNLFTKKPLDRELSASHHLEVIAESTGTGSRAYLTTGYVNVKVSDVNDNAPRFHRRNGTVRLSVPCDPGVLVSTVRAEDPDTDGEVLYRVTSGDALAKFVIDPETGELRTSQRLTSDSFDFQLEISAYDGRFKDVRYLTVEVSTRTISGAVGSQNFVIVVAIGAISGILIVTLSIAIAVVCRQRRKESLKDAKRPFAVNALTPPLSDDLVISDMKRSNFSDRRNSLSSNHSNASSLQLTNSFMKPYNVKPPTTVNLETLAAAKDSDSGCSADMSSSVPWSSNQGNRGKRTPQYSPPTPQYNPQNLYDNMSDYSNNMHGMRV